MNLKLLIIIKLLINNLFDKNKIKSFIKIFKMRFQVSQRNMLIH